MFIANKGRKRIYGVKTSFNECNFLKKYILTNVVHFKS